MALQNNGQDSLPAVDIVHKTANYPVLVGQPDLILHLLRPRNRKGPSAQAVRKRPFGPVVDPQLVTQEILKQ